MNLTDEDRDVIRITAAYIDAEAVLFAFAPIFLAGKRVGIDAAAKVCDRLDHDDCANGTSTAPTSCAVAIRRLLEDK